MHDAHGRFVLLHMLTTSPTGPETVNAQLFLIDLNINKFGDIWSHAD